MTWQFLYGYNTQKNIDYVNISNTRSTRLLQSHLPYYTFSSNLDSRFDFNKTIDFDNSFYRGLTAFWNSKVEYCLVKDRMYFIQRLRMKLNFLICCLLILQLFGTSLSIEVRLKSCTIYQQLWSFLVLCKILCHYKSLMPSKLMPQKRNHDFMERYTNIKAGTYVQTHAY